MFYKLLLSSAKQTGFCSVIIRSNRKTNLNNGFNYGEEVVRAVRIEESMPWLILSGALIQHLSHSSKPFGRCEHNPCFSPSCAPLFTVPDRLELHIASSTSGPITHPSSKP